LLLSIIIFSLDKGERGRREPGGMVWSLETEAEEEGRGEEQGEEGWQQEDDDCCCWGGAEGFCAASWLTTFPLRGKRLVLICTSSSCSLLASAPAKS